MPKRKVARHATLIPSSSGSGDNSDSDSDLPSSTPKSKSPVKHVVHQIGHKSNSNGNGRPVRSTTTAARHIIIGDTSSSSEESDSETPSPNTASKRGLSRSRGNGKNTPRQENGSAKTKTTPKNKRIKIQKSPADSTSKATKLLQKSPASRNIMDYFNKIPKTKLPLELEIGDGDCVIEETVKKATEVSISEQPLPTPATNVNFTVNGDSTSHEVLELLESDQDASSPAEEEVPHVNGVQGSNPEEDTTNFSPESPELDELELECPTPEGPTTSISTPTRKTKSKTKTTLETEEVVVVPDPEPESGRRRSSRLAMQRNIKSYFISDKPDLPSSPESSPEPKSKRKSGKSNSGKGKKSASKGNSQSSPGFSSQPQSQSPVKRKLDAETRDFLYSGVPSTILKAQRQAEKKREQDSWLEVAQFYPRISHTCSANEPEPDHADQLLPTLPFQLHVSTTEYLLDIKPEAMLAFIHAHVQSEYNFDKASLAIPQEMSCCPVPRALRPSPELARALEVFNSDTSYEDPFILKHAPGEDITCLATDSSAVQQFNSWLQTWKDDITESGGTTRRNLPEIKRRKGSDSDFVTSDEDENGVDNDERKKSVILYGPTGCGKSAMVYTIAAILDFKVVEINFSARRSGREVIEMVEEATLSRRLHEKGNGNGEDSGSEEESRESSSSSEEEESQGSRYSAQQHDPRPCLLLFEDVDLVHEEEDDGFHRAIVQLIQSSVRPIVMTISTPAQSQGEENLRVNLLRAIDSKIEKTHPLWITCSSPTTEAVVKALLKIVQSELYLGHRDSTDEYFQAVLAAIAQHANGDVRQAVNQLQFYLSEDWFLDYDKLHQDLCSNGLPLGFGQQRKLGQDANVVLPSADSRRDEDKMENIKSLISIGSGCSLLADFDCMSTSEEKLEYEYSWQPQIARTAQSFFTRHAQKCARRIPMQHYTSLMYEPSSRQETTVTVQHVRNQLGQYLDDDRDYDAIGWLRTIVKQSILNSIGNEDGGRNSNTRRRNGRVKHYFNRMSNELIGEIETTLDFESQKQEVTSIQKAAQENSGI